MLHRLIRMLNVQYAFPLLAVLFWAVNTVVNKMTVGVIFPAVIGFYRWMFAGALFTPCMLRPVLKNWCGIKPHWWTVLILGVLGVAEHQRIAYCAVPNTG